MFPIDLAHVSTVLERFSAAASLKRLAGQVNVAIHATGRTRAAIAIAF